MTTETQSQDFDAGPLFRLPWTQADNAMTWLEPTRQCNITCDACFAVNDPGSRKSLPRIQSELDRMLQLRHCDAMLIAGGEPLTHPRIVEITRMVKARKVKPVIVTNGVGLTAGLVRELKSAGAHGFTLHVDSHQARPGWQGRSEQELNALRQHFADLLHDVGGLTCAFNTTIFPDALDDVPHIVRWATANIDRVHILTLIAVRMISPEWPFDFYAGSRKVDLDGMAYHSAVDYTKITAADILARVRKIIPDFQLCAYIGGTALPHSPKWTLGCRIGTRGQTYGNLGPKSMELLQNVHHFFRGAYLAYTKPSMNRKARALFLFGLFDPEIRKTFQNYVLAALKQPALLFRRLSTQSINILQPIDILPSGEEDTCDGCPNRTFWRNRLVPACRLDDYLTYGVQLKPVPRPKEPATATIDPSSKMVNDRLAAKLKMARQNDTPMNKERGTHG